MDFRRNIATVGALLVLTCLVQVWTICRAVVPAQDAVRYLIVAQGIERDGLRATLQSQPEQPLFPAMACLVHRGLSAVDWIDAGNWAVCLQVAATIPLVLSVLPVYALFCRLHGGRAALVGGLLYCLLGGIARLGADGLSDSTHLALFCLATWAAANYFGGVHPRRSVKLRRTRPHFHTNPKRKRGFAAFSRSSLALRVGVRGPRTGFGEALRRRDAPATAQTRWLALCGLSTGLALMARSEALVLPVAVLTALGWLSIRGGWASAWPNHARAAGALVLSVAALLVPYLALSGTHGIPDAVARLTGRQGVTEAAPLNSLNSATQAWANEPHWDLPGTGRLAFGKKDTSTSARFRGYFAAVAKLTGELARTLHYWIAVVALVGLWRARANLTAPLDRFMQLLCATLVAAALYVAASAGYLSTRHVLLLVVLAIGWAGSGALAVGEWLCAAVLHRRGAAFPGRLDQATAWEGRPTNGKTVFRQHLLPAVTTSLAATIVLVACAPDCLATLHASRAGHRQAASWLVHNAQPSQAVLDSRGWTALYTGRKTYRYEAAQAAFADPSLAYVVVEQAELELPSRRSETLRLLMAQAGEAVARFSADGGDKHHVVIHRWRPDRFQQLGVQSYAR